MRRSGFAGRVKWQRFVTALFGAYFFSKIDSKPNLLQVVALGRAQSGSPLGLNPTIQNGSANLPTLPQSPPPPPPLFRRDRTGQKLIAMVHRRADLKKSSMHILVGIRMFAH